MASPPRLPRNTPPLITAHLSRAGDATRAPSPLLAASTLTPAPPASVVETTALLLPLPAGAGGTSPQLRRLPSQVHLVADPPSPRLTFSTLVGTPQDDVRLWKAGFSLLLGTWCFLAWMLFATWGVYVLCPRYDLRLLGPVPAPAHMGAWVVVHPNVYWLWEAGTVATGAPWWQRAIAWVQQDTYYKYLLPLLGPVAVYFVTWNWFGLKLFRHNA
jgi:hypothetical protein